MTDILDLPDWEPFAVRTEDGEYIISADDTVFPAACQKCGVIGRVYKHGPKMITLRDSPIRGCPVSIEATLNDSDAVTAAVRLSSRWAASIRPCG